MAEGRSATSKRGRGGKRAGGKSTSVSADSGNAVSNANVVAEVCDNELKENEKVCDSKRRNVHRLRFLKQTIYPVRGLSWDTHSKRLAVSRNDGSFEIWSFHADPTRAINHACWFVERRIPGALGRKCESLVWCRGRLFASGTSGLLLEFDAVTFSVAREIPASAGGVVAMAANEKLGKIALASMDGTIVVYDVDDNEGLVYDKTLEKRTERIISLAWHENGDTLVTGCKGHILIWDLGSGRVHSHIALAKSLTKRKGKRGRLLQKACLVWTIRLLVDGTIVTGDSEGNTSFWDVKTATLKTQFKTHDGPILAICVAHDGQTVWCSGVDPRVVEIRRRPSEPSGWQLGHVNMHCKRDVHAMAHVYVPGHSSEGIIFTGDDPRLFITCVRKSPDVEVQLKYGPKQASSSVLPAAPACVSNMIALGRKRGIVASRVNRGVEIWGLGEVSTSSLPSRIPENAILPLQSLPSKLALIPGRKAVKDYYTCAAINADATFLCLSDRAQTDVFALNLNPKTAQVNDEKPQISKVKAFNGILSPDVLFCDFCSFNGDELLVTVTAQGRLEALRVHSTNDESSNLTFQKMTIDLSNEGLPTCLALRTRRFLNVEGAPLAVIGFTSGRVDVVDLVDGRVLTSLPVVKDTCVSAVAVSPDATEIAAVYVNLEIAFFHLYTQKTDYWPRWDQEPSYGWRQKGVTPLPVHKIIYLTPTKLLMHSDKRVHVMDRSVADKTDSVVAIGADDSEAEEEEETDAKRPKLTNDDAPDVEKPFTDFKSLSNFDLVHFVDVLDNGELVVAETTMDKVEAEMPEPLLKKKYGT